MRITFAGRGQCLSFRPCYPSKPVEEATWALTGVTAAMTLATAWLGFQSREAAKTAKGTLQHLESEQGLKQRPLLVVVGHRQQGHDLDLPGSRIDLGSSDFRGPYKGKLVIKVANVGRGPAVDAFIAYRATQDAGVQILVWSTEPVAIAAGGSAEVVTGYPDRTDPPGLFQVRDVEHLNGGELDNPGIPTYVLVCRDETGERIYRFSNRAAGFERWLAGQAEPQWLKAVRSISSWLAPAKTAGR